LTWQAANVVVRRDPANNMKIDKQRSATKVDALVALVMALEGATQHPEQARSIYEDPNFSPSMVMF
jgi:phage terminase large subunit-like protein